MNESFNREGRMRLPAEHSEDNGATPLKRQAIVILGMHRSGTSAFGGVVSALGVAGPKTLAASNEWNPRGYFESARLFHALDEMLASAGSRWDDWRPLDPQWLRSKAAEQYSHKIKNLLIDEFGDKPLIFIKDPRICRFVPFISAILAELSFSAVSVLPVRNPIEVAHSLKRRDKFALMKSILLWLRHLLDAELGTRQMPRCFLSYEEFLLNWRRDVERVAEKTGVKWPDRSERSDAQIDQFLAPELRREKMAFDEIEDFPEVAPLVEGTFNTLLNVIASGESKASLDQLDLMRTEFDEYCQKLEADTLSFRRRWLSGLGVDNNLGEAVSSTEPTLSGVERITRRLGRDIVEAIIREHSYRPIIGDVLLIGHQTVNLTLDEVLELMREHDVIAAGLDVALTRHWDGAPSAYSGMPVAAFFQHLGIASIKTLDVADGAEIVHDLRQPILDHLRGCADFIVDGGAIADMFNPAAALCNYADLLRLGGRLIAINNLSSHFDPYSIPSPVWYLDFFVMESFADCKVYVVVYLPDGRSNAFYVNIDCLLDSAREVRSFLSPHEMAVVFFAERKCCLYRTVSCPPTSICVRLRNGRVIGSD